MRSFYLYVTCLLLAATSMYSCSDDNDAEELATPVITFENEEGIYTAKVGRPLEITPTVTGAGNAFFSWKHDGKIVSTEPAYTFVSDKIGQYYFTFMVNADNGIVERELRVDVGALLPPQIQLPVVDGKITAIVGQDCPIAPSVTPENMATTYRWVIDDLEVSTEATYTFKSNTQGSYKLELYATNEDGTTKAEATISVEPMPGVSLYFDQKEITCPVGAKMVIAPYVSYATESTTYQWTIEGGASGTSAGDIYTFTPTKAGTYTLTVTGTNGNGSNSSSVKVICKDEVAPMRPATATSSAKCNTVYEFLPAPGQFVNEGYSASTMEEANAYAKKQLDAGGYVSLGSFGGYVIVGFDHSIENKDGYDIAITGNSFGGSSEPGVVWVMQDTNGNGKPDDLWYELKGSETGKEGTYQRYSVTFFKPKGNRENVVWKDSKGQQGSVPVNSYHMQPTYYPTWVNEASYTLRGTRLQLKTYQDPNTGNWYNGTFDWGYADNYSSKDLQGKENVFDINNAIYPDGTPAELKHVDFVKVQVGVNGDAGWLGELSTEVLGFRDMHIINN